MASTFFLDKLRGLAARLHLQRCQNVSECFCLMSVNPLGNQQPPYSFFAFSLEKIILYFVITMNMMTNLMEWGNHKSKRESGEREE